MVVVSALALVAFGVIVIVRHLHGPPRIEFLREGILVKPTDVSRISFHRWVDIDHVEMSTSQVTLHTRSDALRVPLSSYAIVRVVKGRLAQLAEEHGVVVKGYW